MTRMLKAFAWLACFIGGLYGIYGYGVRFEPAVQTSIPMLDPMTVHEDTRVLYEVIFDRKTVLDAMETKVFKGGSEYKIVPDGEKGNVLSARSEHGAQMLYNKLDVSMSERPVLTWEWKAREFPSNKANEVLAEKRDNDYAARVYAMFKGLTLFDTDVIQYVWDDHFKEGDFKSSPYASQVKILVVQNTPHDGSDGWVTETRDLYEDYRMLFGKEPGKPLGAVGIMSDSDNTRTRSGALFRFLTVRGQSALKDE